MTQNLSSLPDPMTPEDSYVNGLPYMPTSADNVLYGEFSLLSTGDEYKAADILIAFAWNSKPAGSLPADDRMLAQISRAGANWETVKKMALHGWVKCSDGRLYHPTLAKFVIKAWAGRLAQRKRAQARWDKEREVKATPVRAEQPRQCRGISRGTASTSVSLNNHPKGWHTAEPRAVSDSALEDGAGREAVPKKRDMVPVEGPVAHRAVMAHLPRVVALTGRPERACRGLLGSWRKKLGDDVGTLDTLLTECELQDMAEPVAWMERAISRETGQPMAVKHKTPVERVVDDALGRASRAWAALFDEKRDFGWVQRVWPERAAALGLPGCAMTREAYTAHYAGAGA